MKPIHKILTRELFWKQPRWSREYYELSTESKLRKPDDIVATVAWTRWLSDEAVAITHQDQWTFDRVGFLDRRTVVWDKVKGLEVASVQFGWRGDGTIFLISGKVYRWNRSKTFAPAWIITDADEFPVLEIELGMHWFKQEGVVDLNLMGSNMDDLSLLLPLGFYLGVCAQRDTAAVVAATTAAVT